MFRLMTTIARGRAHEAAEDVAARNAATILGQQIREAAGALDDARKAFAIAEAGLARDEAQLTRLDGRIADLEARVVAAIEKGLEGLAGEGAEEIAELETERDLCRKGVERLRGELSKRKPYLRECESRLRRLCRSRDLVSVRSRVHQLDGRTGAAGLSRIADAEKTLHRIEDAQTAEDAVMARQGCATGSSTIEDKLAEAGCGPARQNSGAAVMERLRQRAGGTNGG